MRILNLGIVAHVDAGKTSLTERLLFDTGVIASIGSVDSGNTQTDSMELERRRGITIKSAVVSFAIGDLQVNLIDTPGHPEFISEVERALRVLDGAILVVSAVEGIQAQTRILMRALGRLSVPTLLFVNKVDRMGASYDRLLGELRTKLRPGVVPMNRVEVIGTRAAATVAYRLSAPAHAERVATTLAENSDEFLAAYLEEKVGPAECERELVRQTAAAVAHPTYFGSARTGVGIDELIDGIRQLLPTTVADPGRDLKPLRGAVFKIERGDAGEKVAYVRLNDGSISAREQLSYFRPSRTATLEEHSGKVTALRVYAAGATPVAADRATTGTIAKVWGLKEIRVGDQLGSPAEVPAEAYFAPPTLETVVRPRDPAAVPALQVALRTLADQDPLIDLRLDEEQHEVSVRLYGEVQKEVLENQLATDFGVEVTFSETHTIYTERLVRAGDAVEELGRHPYPATVGIRIEPGPPGSGVRYEVRSERGTLLRAFHTTIEECVHELLLRGLYGWEIIDCTVALTHGSYTTGAVPGHFRILTPLAFGRALRNASTCVCEPIARFELSAPQRAIGAILATLAELGATPNEPSVEGETASVDGVIAAENVRDLEVRLPGLSRGEGVVWTEFAGYRPVSGMPPRRPGA